MLPFSCAALMRIDEEWNVKHVNHGARYCWMEVVVMELLRGPKSMMSDFVVRPPSPLPGDPDVLSLASRRAESRPG